MQEKLIFSNDVDGTAFDRSGSTFSILKNISTGCFQTVFYNNVKDNIFSRVPSKTK